MPAGNRVLPLRSNIPAISDFVFEGVDPAFPERARGKKAGGIIVGGANYGQGSSREHAALAPRYLGVTAKIVKSFARIHKANLVNFGILPLVFADPSDYDAIQQGDAISLPGVRTAIASGATTITVVIGGRNVLARLDISDRQRQVLLAGSILNTVQ
jgi:aconitate hydratase